jgi:propanediol utilization protein
MEACMKINVGVSARHVHLTQEDYEKLFNEEIKEEKKLNVIGQFKSKKTVKIKTKAGENYIGIFDLLVLNTGDSILSGVVGAVSI